MDERCQLSRLVLLVQTVIEGYEQLISIARLSVYVVAWEFLNLGLDQGQGLDPELQPQI